MSSVLWIDGFKKNITGDYCLKAFSAFKNGFIESELYIPKVTSQVINTNDQRFRRIRTRAMPFSFSDLRNAQPLLFQKEIMDKLNWNIPVSENHVIYRIDAELPIYIPAFLIIRSLFMGSKLLDKYLLVPNAVDLFGLALMTDKEIHIKASKAVRTMDMTGRVARLLAWILMRNDARSAHSSILEFARQGIIDLKIPELSIGGWLRGFEVANGILAVELNALDIRFPPNRNQIRLQVGEKVKLFSAYEPPIRSPWSIEKRLNAQ